MTSLTGYLLSDGVTDLSNVFLNINAPVALLSGNNIITGKTTFNQKVNLSAELFYNMPSTTQTAPPYSIGYTASSSSSSNTVVGSGNQTTSISIYKGVWIVHYNLSITKGGGTYGTTSYIYMDMSSNTNIKYSHSTSIPTLLIPISSNTVTSLQYSLSAVAVVTSDTTLYVNARVIMTLYSSTTSNIYLSITKIA